MDEFIKLLDKNLDYVDHKITDGVCYITIISNRKTVNCPFCGNPSLRVHSTYVRTFQELPIQGNKVVIIPKNRKMFCNNPECDHKTFAERFTWLANKSKKTKRLEDEIVRLSLNCSSTATARFLSENTVAVGKSTICNLLKKGRPIVNKDEVTIVCIDDFALKKREKGFKGSSSTVRHYASEWKKRFKNDIKGDEVQEGKEIITIKRNDILKTLFRPISDIKSLEEDKFEHFCEQYPFFTTVLELIYSFKDIFEQKNPKLLKKWITKAKDTKIKEIISFTNGIERDYDAVKNAICLPYSNGLAEGCVNKIKVIKRIMYGRCSFETLRNKTIRLDNMYKFN